MLTLPYVQVAEFRAYPSFMDSLNLRSGDTSIADQDDELRQMLLMASSMADDFMEFGQNSISDGVLQAHTRTENRRNRVDRDGRFKIHPDHKPILNVTAFSYGSDPRTLQPVSDLTGLWVERSSSFVLPLALGPGMSALQFGRPAYDGEYYTQYTYSAGYVNTILGGALAPGASSIPVLDSTGITGGTSTQPPSVLRLWEPGVEEAVTVAPTYIPGSLNVPITTTIQFTHANAVPTGVSSLPPHAHEAVILYACALLMRPDTEAEDVFPGARRETNTNVGSKSSDGSGFVEEAERLLDGLRRVR
jgi:hypothetical protein